MGSFRAQRCKRPAVRAIGGARKGARLTDFFSTLGSIRILNRVVSYLGAVERQPVAHGARRSAALDPYPTSARLASDPRLAARSSLARPGPEGRPSRKGGLGFATTTRLFSAGGPPLTQRIPASPRPEVFTRGGGVRGEVTGRLGRSLLTRGPVASKGRRATAFPSASPAATSLACLILRVVRDAHRGAGAAVLEVSSTLIATISALKRRALGPKPA